MLVLLLGKQVTPPISKDERRIVVPPLFVAGRAQHGAFPDDLYDR